MYYIFINILWMIVSMVLLMYSDLLLQIKIPLPGGGGYEGCGVAADGSDAEEERYDLVGHFCKLQ